MSSFLNPNVFISKVQPSLDLPVLYCINNLKKMNLSKEKTKKKKLPCTEVIETFIYFIKL